MLAVMERERSAFEVDNRSLSYLSYAHEEFNRINAILQQVETEANDGTVERLAASLERLKRTRAKTGV